jgi:hypothetical protein
MSISTEFLKSLLGLPITVTIGTHDQWRGYLFAYDDQYLVIEGETGNEGMSLIRLKKITAIDFSPNNPCKAEIVP